MGRDRDGPGRRGWGPWDGEGTYQGEPETRLQTTRQRTTHQQTDDQQRTDEQGTH